MSEIKALNGETSGGAKAGSGGTADNEEVLRLDGKVYDDLTAATKITRSRASLSDILGAEKDKVEAFLYWEARLLDGGWYREWLKLLSVDFVYWVPGSRGSLDPRVEGSVNFDDRRRIIDRIALTETHLQYAQIPQSRTCRIVSNIEIFKGEGGVLHTRSNVVIWEHRRGHSQSFVGWQEHELVTGGDQWQIKRKFINLLDCDQPQGNNTFIL